MYTNEVDALNGIASNGSAQVSMLCGVLLQGQAMQDVSAVALGLILLICFGIGYLCAKY